MRDRLIGTVVFGEEYELMARETIPLLAAYAKRCHADLMIVRERKLDRRWPVIFEKWQVGRRLGEYRRVAIVDADMVVMPSAPDVFEEVPADLFGAYNEATHPSWGDGYLDKIMPACLAALKDNAPEVVLNWRRRWNRVYVNAGLWVMSARHAGLFLDPAVDLTHANFVCPEQTFVSALLSHYRVPIHQLGERWNYMTHHAENHDLSRGDVYCWHVTTWNPPGGSRLGTVRELAKKAKGGRGGQGH